jgi:hypothetical protein
VHVCRCVLCHRPVCDYAMLWGRDLTLLAILYICDMYDMANVIVLSIYLIILLHIAPYIVLIDFANSILSHW